MLHTSYFILLLVPGLALAAAPRTFQELAYYVVLILDNATAVLIVLGIVIYFYGISTNILSFKEKGMQLVRNYFFWGIIVLFVMVSLWGILHLVRDTIFGNDAYSPTSGATTGTSGDLRNSGSFNAPQFTK